MNDNLNELDNVDIKTPDDFEKIKDIYKTKYDRLTKERDDWKRIATQREISIQEWEDKYETAERRTKKAESELLKRTTIDNVNMAQSKEKNFEEQYKQELDKLRTEK